FGQLEPGAAQTGAPSRFPMPTASRELLWRGAAANEIASRQLPWSGVAYRAARPFAFFADVFFLAVAFFRDGGAVFAVDREAPFFRGAARAFGGASVTAAAFAPARPFFALAFRAAAPRGFRVLPFSMSSATASSSVTSSIIVPRGRLATV